MLLRRSPWSLSDLTGAAAGRVLTSSSPQGQTGVAWAPVQVGDPQGKSRCFRKLQDEITNWPRSLRVRILSHGFKGNFLLISSWDRRRVL